MSTMPGPFVGGGAHGSTERGPRPGWQAPYAPGLEESQVEEPFAGPEAVLDTTAEPADAVAPPVAPFESPMEAPHTGKGQSEPEPPPAERSEPPAETADVEIVSPAVGGEDAGSFDMRARPSTGPEEAVQEEGAVGEDEGEDEGEIEYPDYIFGPEDEDEAAEVPGMSPESPAGGLEEPEESAADVQETAGAEPPEDPARAVGELMEGPLGAELRELMVRLEGLPTSEAVARAFAAGYRKGQMRGEN